MTSFKEISKSLLNLIKIKSELILLKFKIKLKELPEEFIINVLPLIELNYELLNEQYFNLINSIDSQSISLIIWLISSILLLFSNRYILIQFNFKFTLTLTSFQTLITLILTRIIALNLFLSSSASSSSTIKNRKSSINWNSYFNRIIPIGIAFAISTIGTAVACNYLPLMVLQLIPCAAPLLTEFGRKVLKIKNCGGRRKWGMIAFIPLCLAGAIAGGLRFGAFDTELTAREKFGIHYVEVAQVLPRGQFGLAVLLLMVGVLAETVGTVLLEKSIKSSSSHGSDKLRPAELLYHFIPITSICLVIASLSLEPGAVKELFNLPPAILVYNAFCAIAVFCSIPYVIQTSSSTSLSLATGVKNAFCTFLACIIYSIGVGYLHAIGFFFALLGFSKYLNQLPDSSIVYDTSIQESPGPMKEKELANLVRDERADSSSSASSSDELNILLETNSKIRPTKPTASHNLFSIVMILIILVVITVTDRKPHTTYLPDQPQYRTLLNRTKVATIIEPRNLPHLGPLVLHFLSVLPDDWPMVIWTSTANMAVLEHNPSLLRHIQDGRLNLTLLPYEVDLHNGEFLSRFLTRPWFWEQFGTAEWMLFFQSDSILCSRSQQSIEDWLGFDWVGAPWNDNAPEGAAGGNGGLSMRKISSMLKITRSNDRREDNGRPEDVYFSEALGKLEGTKWPTRHQGYFSVEEQHASMSEWAWAPFGMHSGGKGHTQAMWQDKDRLSRLMEWCPEVNLFYSSITLLPLFTETDIEPIKNLG